MSAGPGDRIGIVGENGSGKSTLMRLLAGAEHPDDGAVRVTGEVGYLGQELDLPPTHTVQQAVDTALADLRAMERRLRELESALTEEATDAKVTAAEITSAEIMDEYGELLTAYELRGGYEADARVNRAFHGLGLAHVSRDRRLSSLSGGERARLGLACVLAAAPRVLLLDEPTNHLDESALTWLEDRLREHRGAVAVVSHDRVFLDRVATAIVEVEHGSATRFGGGYTGFLASKAAARARWEQSYAAWCEEVRQVRAYASTTAHRVAAGRVMRDNNKMAYDRNAGRVQSSVATRVRNAQERLRRLEAAPVPRPPAPLRFHGSFDAPVPLDEPHAPQRRPVADAAPDVSTGTDAHPDASMSTDAHPDASMSTDAGARILLELRDVRVGDRLHLESLTIRKGERLLVQGANGAGKSTLLRALADGATGCRVGYLPQEVSFDPAQSVLEAYGEGFADERRTMLLNTGLFQAHTLDQKVGELSVGQRRRLALARLLAREHDVLLLDEPTNHLSPALAEELEEALTSYRGALVLVSHDRALVRRFRGTRIELIGGRVR
ncbi:ABC-F family ATP-binding cassette domain-containing protein [Nonomuraea sp. PA05]|uniref:ABC-F family ATP-binding cassette domain-containing protein n=1 Tax=Nonomuraea sp. PA05 TaxID=2604466 RepID=UPI0021CCD3D5|nr:ABC-F family ATP-binding cassette domain-containing protein [Nonomuraea sp. PA05]